MKEIVILGSSCAGHTLALSVKEKLPSWGVTVVTEDAHLFYDRRRLPEYLAGAVKEKTLFPAPDIYAGKGIRFLPGCKAVNVNGRKKQISVMKDESREGIAYDLLAICTGTRTNVPEIAGVNKEGVLKPDSFDDFKSARRCLFGDTVCFIGWSGYACHCARMLLDMKKDLKVIAGAGQPVPALEGMEVIHSSVIEIIGESGVQAVKLKEGKVIGTSLAVLFTGSKPNTDFLRESGIELRQGLIATDENGKTSLDSVYACGSVSTSLETGWEATRTQAQALAATLSKLAEADHVGSTR